MRLFESVRASKTAATAAIDAMRYAPDARCYEVMRNVIFQRFLDVENLSAALAAILDPPFSQPREDRSPPLKGMETHRKGEKNGAEIGEVQRSTLCHMWKIHRVSG